MVRKVLLLAVALLLFSVPAYGGVLFSDSFESGDGSAWNFHSGTTEYVNSGCQDGTWCVKKTITGGTCQVAVFEDKILTYPQDLWVKWYVKFPVGFSFDNQPACNTSADHKLLIVEGTSTHGRCTFSAYNGSGSQAQFSANCGGTEITNNGGRIWGPTNVLLTADGQWHELVYHAYRVPGDGAGKIEAWYDGIKVLDDQDYTVCIDYCDSVNWEIKVGAYINYGATNTQSFFIDNVTVADTSLAPSGGPPKRRLGGGAISGGALK